MELLPDPLKDRFVKTVEPPPHKPLNDNILWPGKGNITHFNIRNVILKS